MNWYLLALKKYNVFTGRSRRSEYWYFILINFLNSLLTSYMDQTFGTIDTESGFGYFNLAYAIAMFLPGLAVGIRRMHDVGKSGWYILFPIYNIVLAATPGVVGDNEYGSDPKDDTLIST